MFVHIRSGHLAARALGAVRLLERATTPAERAAAEGLARKLAAQGVVAEAIEVPVPAGAPARLSDDGVLLVRGAVWWRGVLLAGVAGALGFDQWAKPLEMSDAGAWRMWFAGPPRAVEDLRVLFALMSFCVAVASRGFDLSFLNRERIFLAMGIGAVGASVRDARWREPNRAIVRHGGRETPRAAEGKQEGEGTKQLVAFMGLAGVVFGEFIAAGKTAASLTSRLWR